ncbi:hypothetical protein SLEP1_g52708 [Rubroshorea leprosula]|uniref:Uncharacterized protein n=1 Tax=Rubroshorea leprosula TaxID=152421 RepID=A0AAV5M885_9ROSI|nr:hypothetical protein SLEP1_g52708 [Rubroshorea leprosula]
MKMERRTVRMTGKVAVLLIILIIANQILYGGCSRPVPQERVLGPPSGPCNCGYVPGGGN